MADTTFVDNSPPTVDASWLNDVNLLEYHLLGNAGTPPATRADILANLGVAPGDYLQVANNLSDLQDVPTARTNMGLGTMAVQDADAVAITGGTIDGVEITGLTSPLAKGSGGTGQTTYTNGQLLIGNTAGGTLAKATLTAGAGISVTNGAGSITLANTAIGFGGATTITSNTPSDGVAQHNTHATPLQATVRASGNSSSGTLELSVSDDNSTYVVVGRRVANYSPDTETATLTAIVPPGWYWKVSAGSWSILGGSVTY